MGILTEEEMENVLINCSLPLHVTTGVISEEEGNGLFQANLEQFGAERVYKVMVQSFKKAVADGKIEIK